LRPGLAVAVALLMLVACSDGGSTAGSTPSPLASTEPSPVVRPSGQLDAQVPVPAGFPKDMPVYANARLTAGATFKSSGQVSWGMEWETLDAVDKVRAFYAEKLNQGDWSITITTSAPGSFSATFTRKSDAQVLGALKSDRSSGVTKILMSLVAPAS
jgi:hypothetical protein